MKILIYNWAQFDSPVMAGGGVTLYLRNIITELLSRDGVELWFLSSGDRYGFLNRKPAIVETSNALNNPRMRSFTLVNSPIKAPAHSAFNDVDRWLRDRVTTDLLSDFIRDNGPFDVLHLHNLEGLGAGVLNLEKGASIGRIFYTFHNYMPVCPQIELLYDNRKPCQDYHDGQSCVGCLATDHRMDRLIAFDRIGGAIKGRGLAGHPIGGFLFDGYSGTRSILRAFKNLTRDVLGGLRNGFRHWHMRPRSEVGRAHDWQAGPRTKPLHSRQPAARILEGASYRQWREANGLALQRNMDGIFAVSDLCAQTAMRFLPPGTRVETLLLPIDIEISPDERRRLRETRPAVEDAGGTRTADDGLTLSFIGYDIASKGLPFLIDALAAIDDPFYRQQVDLLIVARLSPQRERQLAQLQTVFRSVRVIPSYGRDQLAELSQMIDLNIVPSIWWETFNQVTVELARLGVPSLLSSNVGAKQTLTRPGDFVFTAEDATDLRAKLDSLLRDPALRAGFFDAELHMPSLKAHVDLLMDRYSGPERSGLAA